MTERYDLVIVGAGIHGAGCAQAAALNGLRTLVLEKTAVGAGTSSKSSKLIHGGLRYLESAQFRLVQECLRERAILLKNAPHLVKPTPFLIPVYQNTTRPAWQIAIGLALYGLLTGGNRLSRFRILTPENELVPPGLLTQGRKTVFQYWDAQTDDRKLTESVMASAQSLGATLMQPATLLSAHRNADGYRVQIAVSTGTVQLQTRFLLNAGGPWINEIQNAITPAPPMLDVDLVQGTHIELDVAAPTCCLYVEAPQDRRAVFVMPWHGRTLVGTTEKLHTAIADLCAPTQDEIDYLTAVYRHYFPQQAFNVVDSWAGLRVLPRAKSSVFNRTRELVLLKDDDNSPALAAIYGGKLTSYRADCERIVKTLLAIADTHAIADKRGAYKSTQDIPLPKV